MPMTIAEALRDLGATPDLLSPEERRALDEDGYLILRGVMTRDEVQTVRARLDALLEEEGAGAGEEWEQEPGAARLSNLINKGEAFRVLLSKPKHLAAVAHVLDQRPISAMMNSRNALPGHGHQELHPDWIEPARGDYVVCNSLWMIDDFTPDNGATRLVPGSHKFDVMPRQGMANAMEKHPQEVQALGQAGDVVVMNSHCWHAGAKNDTDQPRRAIHNYFTRADTVPQFDFISTLRRETWEMLSPAQRVILGVDPDRFVNTLTPEQARRRKEFEDKLFPIIEEMNRTAPPEVQSKLTSRRTAAADA